MASLEAVELINHLSKLLAQREYRGIMAQRIKAAGAERSVVSAPVRVICFLSSAVVKTLQRILGREETRLAPDFVPLAFSDELQGNRIYQYPSLEENDNLLLATSQTIAQSFSPPVPGDLMVLYENNCTNHATLLQLWDILHKPRQLGLENLPIPLTVERILYRP